MANVKNGFSVAEILASRGQKLVVKNNEPLKLELQKVQLKQDKKPVPYVCLKAQMKHLDSLAKEQIQKAVLHGADPDYIISPSRDKEPIFVFKDNYLQAA